MRTGLAVLRRERPDVAGALDDALAAARTACPGDLLALCRARVRMLLGGTVTGTDPRLHAVGDYATSELFDDTERLALEFTEQYVLDVAAMPDPLVAGLRERLGNDGLYALAMGLYAVDQIERLELSTVVHPASTR